jgi:hypothetical protein
MASLSEIIGLLPYRIRSRFDSLSTYVAALIAEVREGRTGRVELSRDDVHMIQAVAFIYSIDSFFRDGTRAAAKAVDEFSRLGVTGFMIGNTAFTGRNDNVMLGENLSKVLKNHLGSPRLVRIIERAKGLKMLVGLMVRELGHG